MFRQQRQISQCPLVVPTGPLFQNGVSTDLFFLVSRMLAKCSLSSFYNMLATPGCHEADIIAVLLCHQLLMTECLHSMASFDALCYTRCPNPPTGKDKTSMTMQHAKEGKFIADSSQGPCCKQCSSAKSESPEPQFPRTFIGCSISNISSG